MENIKRADKIVRLAVGTNLVQLTYNKKMPIKIISYLGLGLIFTSISGFSPLYFCINQKMKKEKVE